MPPGWETSAEGPGPAVTHFLSQPRTRPVKLTVVLARAWLARVAISAGGRHGTSALARGLPAVSVQAIAGAAVWSPDERPVPLGDVKVVTIYGPMSVVKDKWFAVCCWNAKATCAGALMRELSDGVCDGSSPRPLESLLTVADTVADTGACGRKDESYGNNCWRSGAGTGSSDSEIVTHHACAATCVTWTPDRVSKKSRQNDREGPEGE